MTQIPFTLYDFFGYLSAGVIVLVSADYAFNDAAELHSRLGTAEAVIWVVLAYVTGHALANVARTVLERWIVERLLGRIPTETLMGKAPRHAIWPWIFPDYFRPLATATRERVAARAVAENLPLIDPGRDTDSRDAADALRNACQRNAAQEGAEPDERFPALRDFARNTSLACALAAIFILTAESPPSRWWGIAAAAASVALFYRFLRFHRFYEAALLKRFARPPPVGVIPDTPSAPEIP